jgi:hypothetical protein
LWVRTRWGDSIVKSGVTRWQLWGLRSSVLDRVLLALAVGALLWLLGAWAMDWL